MSVVSASWSVAFRYGILSILILPFPHSGVSKLVNRKISLARKPHQRLSFGPGNGNLVRIVEMFQKNKRKNE